MCYVILIYNSFPLLQRKSVHYKSTLQSTSYITDCYVTFSGFQDSKNVRGISRKGVCLWLRNVAWITSDEFDNVEDDISFQRVSRKNEKIEIQCHGIPDGATGLRRNAPKNSCCIISPNLYRCWVVERSRQNKSVTAQALRPKMPALSKPAVVARKGGVSWPQFPDICRPLVIMAPSCPPF